MPKGAKATTQLAEALVLERAKEQPVSICKRCGITARRAESGRLRGVRRQPRSR